MNLFDQRMPFWKGNLHCHTNKSDGRLSPEEIANVYRELGHDFLAITDHRILSPETHMDGDMLLLSGLEMDYWFPGETLHIVGVGMGEEYNHCELRRMGPQGCINAMRQCGGRAIIAHPAWSLNTASTLCALRNVTAAEVFNSVSTVPWNGDRADSSNILDVAAVRGALFNFVATDDTHRCEGEAGRNFTMIQAEELTQEALFDALDRGRFYCSQGPRFEQITVEDGRVEVRCSPVQTVIFYSNLVWARGRCVTGEELTAARYDLTLNSGETFVRVQLIDHAGRSAWSNPIAL